MALRTTEESEASCVMRLFSYGIYLGSVISEPISQSIRHIGDVYGAGIGIAEQWSHIVIGRDYEIAVVAPTVEKICGRLRAVIFSIYKNRDAEAADDAAIARTTGSATARLSAASGEITAASAQSATTKEHRSKLFLINEQLLVVRRR